MSELHPGWVDAHTHLYAGLAELAVPDLLAQPASAFERSHLLWWRLDRALDLQILRAAARLYVAEALLEGTTAIVDHHESPSCIEGSLDVLADACQELGMRALLCYAATERNGGRAEARRGLAECKRFARANTRPLVRATVGLHASFTVSDDTLREAGEIALRLGSVVHVRVAEGPHDEQDAMKRGFESSFSRLASLGALPHRSILAQGVHLSQAAVQAASDHELWIVQCPRANQRDGAGHPRTLGESERVALGSDAFRSNVIEETDALLRAASKHEETLERAIARVRGGERLIAERFGPGAAHKASVGRGRISVGGRDVVVDGRLVTGDIDEIRAHAQEAALRLWQRMAES